MSTSNTADSPIINNPIVNSPIVSSPIISSTISTDGEPAYHDFNDACGAGMPAGNRVFYFKFVFYMFAIVGGALFALFKLCEYMGWFN